MNEKQLNEGVKEVVLALLSLAANTYTVDYIHKQLEKRPESDGEKIQALQKLDGLSKIKNSEFDDTVDTLLKHYKSKPVLVKGVRQDLPKKTNDNISDDLVEFIKKHEHFSPTPYWDYKQYSIGYGTKAEPNDVEISEEEAFRRLKIVVKKHRDVVVKAERSWGYEWSQKQIDALTSFRFNVGSIGQLTNNGTRDNYTIAKKILEYDKAGGKPLRGLTVRRQNESQLFVNNDI